ncbi:MAG: hypothetical protein R2749_01570 [Acidimicrobiales bacterium]
MSNVGGVAAVSYSLTTPEPDTSARVLFGMAWTVVPAAVHQVSARW